MKVKEFTIKKITVDSIKFDKTNPNIVSDEQMEALKKGMEKFGYLSPIIVNQKMEVLDGEHRARVYQELGEKTIPAYVIDVDKIDGKMLRQIMNKLHGEHDTKKDSLEYKIIEDAGKLEEFVELIAQPKQKFLDALSVEVLPLENKKIEFSDKILEK